VIGGDLIVLATPKSRACRTWSGLVAAAALPRRSRPRTVLLLTIANRLGATTSTSS